MKNTTKMVSLDTSSTITGIAFWENAICTKSGILYHKNEKDTIIRIENMCIDIINNLKSFKPHIVVCEQPPLCNSPKTCIMLSEIVGCVKGYALTNDCDYIEFSPNEWRKLVAGKEEAIPRKRDVCKDWDMKKYYELTGKEAEDDNEADAYLIGIARINQFQNAI